MCMNVRRMRIFSPSHFHWCSRSTAEQPIIDHDEHGELLQQSTEPSIACPSHDNTDETDSTLSVDSTPAQTCWICLEPYHVGELVSWSSTVSCKHAFHPYCIETWLIRHEYCPICRRIYMLCDHNHNMVPKQELKVLRKVYKKRRQSTHFCIQDGLVIVDVSLTEKDSQQHVKVEANTMNEILPSRKKLDLDNQDAPTCAEEGRSEAFRMPMDSDGKESTLQQRSMTLSCRSALSVSTAGGISVPLSDVNASEEDKVILAAQSTETASTATPSVLSVV